MTGKQATSYQPNFFYESKIAKGRLLILFSCLICESCNFFFRAVARATAAAVTYNSFSFHLAAALNN